MVDEFVYERDGTEGVLSIKVLRGAFLFVGGTDRIRDRLTEDLDRELKLKSAKPHRHPRIQRRGAANRRVFSPSGLKRNQPIQRLLTHVTISDFPSGFSHQRLCLSPYLGGLYPVK